MPAASAVAGSGHLDSNQVVTIRLQMDRSDHENSKRCALKRQTTLEFDDYPT